MTSGSRPFNMNMPYAHIFVSTLDLNTFLENFFQASEKKSNKVKIFSVIRKKNTFSFYKSYLREGFVLIIPIIIVLASLKRCSNFSHVTQSAVSTNILLDIHKTTPKV